MIQGKAWASLHGRAILGPVAGALLALGAFLHGQFQLDLSRTTGFSTATSSTSEAMVVLAPLDNATLSSLRHQVLTNRPKASATFDDLIERVSRRNLEAELALLDDSAAEGNLPGALQRYNRILLVHPEAGGVLLPVLARALAFPETRDALIQFRQAPWFSPLAAMAVKMNADPAVMSWLLGILPQGPQRDDIISGYIRRLVSANDGEAVRKVIQQQVPSLSNAIDWFAFNSQTFDSRLGPLAWTMSPNVEEQRGTAGNDAVSTELQPTTIVTLLRRTTLLRPGNYDLTYRVSTFGEGSPPAITFGIKCLAGASAVAAVATTGSVDRAGLISVAVKIPVGCPVQEWRVNALGPDGQFPQQVKIDSLRACPESC